MRLTRYVPRLWPAVMLAGAVTALVMAWRELPSLRRYLRMRRM